MARLRARPSEDEPPEWAIDNSEGDTSDDAQHQPIRSDHEDEDTTQPDGGVRKSELGPEPSTPPRLPSRATQAELDDDRVAGDRQGAAGGNGGVAAYIHEEVARFHSGLLPPVETLRGYAEILPDAPERLMKIAERSVMAQEDRADKLADAQVETAKTGQGLAFTLAFICVVAAIVFFALGNNVGGSVMVGLPVVMLIRAFLPSKGDKD